MAQVFPERFFDVLYQNEEVFKKTAEEANVCFLPGVDFRVLFSLNISETTKQSLWRYLQLLLFQIMEEVKNKTAFGETANIFEGIKEEDLQQKLQETFEGLQAFFKGGSEDANSRTEGSRDEDTNEEPKSTPPFAGIDMEKIQEHLKKLMGGRIGSLVQELMDDLKGDFDGFQDELRDHFGDTGEGQPNMGEIMKQMMKDPTKIMRILKKVSEKLKTHMTTENQEEYMRETMDMMKEMGGRDEFMRMFEQMKQNMGGAGKNVRMDHNAVSRMEKNAAIKERMRRNLQQKSMGLEKRADGSQVFKIEGQEQPKTTSKEDIELLMKQYGLEDSTEAKTTGKKKKKQGKK